MKPAQRGLGLGNDHLETVGGRHRYLRHMVTHHERMAKVGPVVGLEAPKAAFGGGKYRTPQGAGQRGKSEKQQSDEFKEVSEAFRRVLEVHKGGRKSGMEHRAPDWQVNLAANISRNRKLGSKQTTVDASHASELYHQRRRIANSYSATERKKNKLDPDVYPVFQMRKSRFSSASDLLAQEYARQSGVHPSPRPRPHSASGAQTARPAYSSVGAALATGSSGSQSARSKPATGSQRVRPASASAARPTERRVPPAVPASARHGSSETESTSARPASASVAGAAGTAPPPSSSYGDVSLGKPTSNVGELRRRLLEQIVDRRFFRESELRPFLLAVVRGNKHLDQAVLKEAVRAVETEFYL
mmetsp:Transcript_17649/g.45297  ORF Transcript_17649/g.45297 Transcript_17649/m.45297 type:complete len:359 (-) Transcript_17649:501-1577(-)